MLRRLSKEPVTSVFVKFVEVVDLSYQIKILTTWSDEELAALRNLIKESKVLGVWTFGEY